MGFHVQCLALHKYPQREETRLSSKGFINFIIKVCFPTLGRALHFK